MYIPESFRETNREILFDFVGEYGFATVVSLDAADPMVSHVPLLLDRTVPGHERLLGHVARANQHWQRFDGSAGALTIFHGPHAYASPSWYANHPSVPTWNYAVVHVFGQPKIVDAGETLSILRRLIEQYEGRRETPWDGSSPADFVANDLQAIVGFEIPIDQIEGKFKLSQNKEPGDREGALVGLAAESNPASRELAEFTRSYFAKRRRE